MRVIAVVTSLCTCIASAAVAQDKFFDSSGTSIRYIDQGRGSAVVLLHGNGGSIESNWVEPGIVAGLAAHHRVIAMDFRGYGKSAKPHQPSAYGQQMGLDAIRLLDHLGLKRAHLVGYSLGARVAAWILVNHPERLLTVTLGASTYFVDTPEQRRSFEALARAVETGEEEQRIRRENASMSEADLAAFMARRAKENDGRPWPPCSGGLSVSSSRKTLWLLHTSRSCMLSVPRTSRDCRTHSV